MKDQSSLDDSGPIVLGNRTHRHLASSILLDEAVAPRHIRFTIALMAGAIVAFVIWAMVAELDTVTSASGQIAPSGTVQVISHQDGGTIAKIAVSEGDRVKKGQLLMSMDKTEAESQLKTAEARFWGLTARVARLSAQSKETWNPPEFGNFPAEYAHLAREQAAILASHKLAVDNQETILKSQVSQRRSEISRLNRQIAVGQNEARILQQVAGIRSDLEQDRLVTRVERLETERALVVQSGELEKLRAQTTEIAGAIEEIESRAKALRTDRRQIAHDEMGLAQAELAQVNEQLSALRKRLERSDIFSPVDGITQDMRYRTVGGVIPPNSQVMNVVPVNDVLEADVRIRTSDIGFVRVGQPVRVKVLTYDFLRYGTVDGTVQKLSASTFLDEKGEPYFKGSIKLSKGHMGADPKEMLISPGMTVACDIVTDRKTVLAYLARPVANALSQGMRER